jgi:hypothetical protein
MIKIENIEVFNFDGALKGMRNPLESWDKSDSYWADTSIRSIKDFIIGEEDMKLALKLIKAGSDHSKFMRQILVSMNIEAPIYWWKEADTYKVATVANSTSTMHKMGSRLLTFNDFSWDKITPFRDNVLIHLNKLIVQWQKSEKKDKEVWRDMIQDLPSSFNQMRTWTANYQILRNIYFARKSHKLQEWKDLCKVIESLPYSELITAE